MFAVEAKKLGIRGVSIIVASGDDGANSFLARTNKSACGLSPSFPATCPWVVAVGATQGPANFVAEIAETSEKGGVITSGGGFSKYYPAPDFMLPAVNGYLATVSPKPTGDFNASLRAYPDLAMIGKNYQTTIGGFTRGVCGTSASAPVVAGMFALLNAQRLKAGKPSLGYVLPQLYSNSSSVANDVTEGKNNCCAGQNVYSVTCCPHGASSCSTLLFARERARPSTQGLTPMFRRLCHVYTPHRRVAVRTPIPSRRLLRGKGLGSCHWLWQPQLRALRRQLRVSVWYDQWVRRRGS